MSETSHSDILSNSDCPLTLDISVTVVTYLPSYSISSQQLVGKDRGLSGAHRHLGLALGTLGVCLCQCLECPSQGKWSTHSKAQ